MAERLRVDPVRRAAEALQEERARRAGDPLGEGEVGAQKIALRSSDEHDDRGHAAGDVEEEPERLALGAEGVDQRM